MTKSTDTHLVKKPKHKLLLSIRNSFFTGVVVALPILATIWVISFVVSFIDQKVKPIFPKEDIPEWLYNIPGLGVLVAIVGLWMLGAIASNFFGSRMLRFGENILNRVPLVSTVYKTVKQIVGAVTQQKDKAFREVCMIEYPRKGLYAVGFVTSDLKGAPADHLTDDYVCIFVPTTPNPTSGFLLFVKRADITILDMTPEEGAKMIISGGMVTSNDEGDDDPKLISSS